MTEDSWRDNFPTCPDTPLWATREAFTPSHTRSGPSRLRKPKFKLNNNNKPNKLNKLNNNSKLSKLSKPNNSSSNSNSNPRHCSLKPRNRNQNQNLRPSWNTWTETSPFHKAWSTARPRPRPTGR